MKDDLKTKIAFENEMEMEFDQILRNLTRNLGKLHDNDVSFGTLVSSFSPSAESGQIFGGFVSIQSII